MYDVIIIGAGIIGCFLAHDLSKLDCSVLVIDKNADIADGASMANSAIVHAGYDPEKGTLKGKLNVKGNRMYPSVCEQLGVSFQKTSAFVAATCEEENKVLESLKERADLRKIPYLVLSGKEARAKEKNLSINVIRVLEFPTTGIIYPWEVAIALMEEAVLNGTTLHLEEEVTTIEKKEQFIVTTETIKGKQHYESRYIINAAGVFADNIYNMLKNIKHTDSFKITPKRGEYYVLDHLKEPLVERVIYPVPGPNGKGVLVIPTTHGNYLIGPNSQIVSDKEALNTTSQALAYVKKNAAKTVDNIPFDKIIRTFAGIRPSGEERDFIIEEAKNYPGFVNVACIDSPGLASAPAISQYVLEEVMQDKFNFSVKTAAYIYRKRPVCLKELADEEKNRLVKERPDYGEIICRCEQVSRGEIVDAIRNVVGAKTVKGIKKRVRPGMGRCQGGFCEPEVIGILAHELKVSPADIRLDSADSIILENSVKGDA